MGSDLGTLLIRADATISTGTGHLMRCIALADEWASRGAEVWFLTKCDHTLIKNRIQSEGHRIFDLERIHPDRTDLETIRSIIGSSTIHWVILDGYHFEVNYQKEIKKLGVSLMVIDDNAHLDYYIADILLNQNIYADSLTYNIKPKTKLLLGLRYVLLRSEFLEWQDWKRSVQSNAQRILVTLGGFGTFDSYKKILQALTRLSLAKIKCEIVLGGNTNPDMFHEFLKSTKMPVKLHSYVYNMPKLMADADIAISAGGSTCWELAYMSVPSLLIIMANNQKEAVIRLDKLGVFSSLGVFEEFDCFHISKIIERLLCSLPERKSMSKKGGLLIDGDGAKRVIDTLAEAVM